MEGRHEFDSCPGNAAATGSRRDCRGETGDGCTECLPKWPKIDRGPGFDSHIEIRRRDHRVRDPDTHLTFWHFAKIVFQQDPVPDA